MEAPDPQRPRQEPAPRAALHRAVEELGLVPLRAGLYTSFDKASKDEVSAVVCLFNPGEASPSAIADLQGVPAQAATSACSSKALPRDVEDLNDWRQGGLAPDVKHKQLDDAARAIERAFRRSGSTSTYFPCHRVVLSLSESDKIASGIPESALVMEGPYDTSSYTLSLFDLASGTGKRTWGDLLQAVRATNAEWRKELDEHFLLALKEELFWPIRAACARRQEPGRGRTLPSDPLQHRSRARSWADVGQNR